MVFFMLFGVALAVAVFAVQSGHGNKQRESLRDRRRRRSDELD